MKKILIITLVIFSCIISAESFAQATAQDPDLKLSIEELKKKYPIDWLSKKYGAIKNDLCATAGEYDVDEVSFWPCGPFCSKYPNKKGCSPICYSYKDMPKNLVCSFFKTEYVRTDNSYNPIKTPLPRFEDFSYEEIKSALIYYNQNFKDRLCNEFQGDCNRAEELVAIAFIHFLSKPEASLSKEEILLKSFLFSKRINTKFNNSKKSSLNLDNCKLFYTQLIAASDTNSNQQSFCSYFTN